MPRCLSVCRHQDQSPCEQTEQCKASDTWPNVLAAGSSGEAAKGGGG